MTTPQTPASVFAAKYCRLVVQMFETLTSITDKTRSALRQAAARAPARRAGRGSGRKSEPGSALAPGCEGDPAGFSAARLAQLGRPLRDQTRELADCQALLDRGRDLARQERWEALCAEVAAADARRGATVAGTPEAELLAAGARSDLARAFESASSAGALSRGHRMFAGLQALDDIAADLAPDPGCAAVVALSHMDAGWAWYKQGWRRGRPEQHVAAFRSSFARAEAILAPYTDAAAGSPLLASTHCALLAGQPGAERQVVDRYETLIGLAPGMPGHMRAFGLHLLPCWFGSYEALDLAARRMAAVTGETWGSGGYAWVWFDALLQDPAAFTALDAGYFVEAIDDILRRHPGQHMVNLFAACLSQLLTRETGPDRSQRRLLDKMRTRLIRSDMRETHGWVWSLTDIGYATPGSAHVGGAEIGARQAWEALSTVLARELRRIQGQPSPAP